MQYILRRSNTIELTNNLKKYKDFDPNWTQARNHGLASKVGISST